MQGKLVRKIETTMNDQQPELSQDSALVLSRSCAIELSISLQLIFPNTSRALNNTFPVKEDE